MIWLVAIGFSSIGVLLGIIGLILLFIKDDDVAVAILGIAAGVLVFAIIFVACGAVETVNATQEARTFEQTREMVEAVLETSDGIANAGIVQKIMEYNDWLAKAKADVTMWRGLSVYAHCNVEKLEYITI